jgi:prophage maintenance system killer protein
MEALTNNHAFVDGYKRVSFVVADALLRANGYFLDVEPLKLTYSLLKQREEMHFGSR